MAASAQQPQHWETNRVEAFSDGVFAIAITLLVLEIKIEPGGYEHLGRALADEWPAYLAYVTSFLTIGSLWIAHHRLFNHLRYVDQVLLRLNLLLLMAVSFLPFPTAVLATAFHADDRAERIAIGFYGGTAIVIDLLLRASVRYALTQPELTTEPELLPQPDQPRAPRGERGWRQLISSIAYGGGIIAGVFIFPKLAAAVYLAVAIRGALVISSGGSAQGNIRRALRGA